MDRDCVFCKIVAGDIEADVVYEGERVVAFRDINAQAPTHVQIIPREHVARISEFEPSRDEAWLVELFQAARRIAELEGLEKGFRLVMNNGALAGQSVAHVHLHLLGGRQLSWPPG
jgi:histidine triad (HIT) family protein